MSKEGPGIFLASFLLASSLLLLLLIQPSGYQAAALVTVLVVVVVPKMKGVVDWCVDLILKLYANLHILQIIQFERVNSQFKFAADVAYFKILKFPIDSTLINLSDETKKDMLFKLKNLQELDLNLFPGKICFEIFEMIKNDLYFNCENIVSFRNITWYTWPIVENYVKIATIVERKSKFERLDFVDVVDYSHLQDILNTHLGGKLSHVNINLISYAFVNSEFFSKFEKLNESLISLETSPKKFVTRTIPSLSERTFIAISHIYNNTFEFHKHDANWDNIKAKELMECVSKLENFKCHCISFSFYRVMEKCTRLKSFETNLSKFANFLPNNLNLRKLVLNNSMGFYNDIRYGIDIRNVLQNCKKIEYLSIETRNCWAIIYDIGELCKNVKFLYIGTSKNRRLQDLEPAVISLSNLPKLRILALSLPSIPDEWIQQMGLRNKRLSIYPNARKSVKNQQLFIYKS